MLAAIFIKARLDPWVVMGTMMNFGDMQGNAHIGLGHHMIVEGDEYRAAFLHYHPYALILNNIETDHLDFYKTFENILRTFKKLVSQLPPDGIIIANADDPNVMKILKNTRCKVITFGLEQGDYQATHIVQNGELTRFAVKGLERFDIALRVPGQHNVKNALAATVLSLFFGIKVEMIQAGLLEFPGVWRRFEIKGEVNGVIIIDDYAHHPTEIKATLSTARSSYPKKKIWCVFQPHSLDRTTYLFDEFANAFADCDQVILTDIYQVAGRDNKQSRSIEELAKAIRDTGKSVKLIKENKAILSYCKKSISGNDVILTVGAGTITELSGQLINGLK
jgi:UDP-N-acetylmuramate--alanine ligase